MTLKQIIDQTVADAFAAGAELHVYVLRGRPERVEVEVWEVDASGGDVA